jgi:hypothetical protein
VPHEESLLKDLKLKALGLSSLQHTITRQESRATWIHEGDANSRRRRNFIRSLEHGGQVAMLEDDKAEVALEFFEGIMAEPPIRTQRVKLEQLDLRHADLSGLCGRFFEQEVWLVIKSLPPDKVPGPDGFSARFLQAAWPIIHHDLMLAFDSFWRLDSRNLH